jgi:hypothetical protein
MRTRMVFGQEEFTYVRSINLSSSIHNKSFLSEILNAYIQSKYALSDFSLFIMTFSITCCLSGKQHRFYWC